MHTSISILHPQFTTDLNRPILIYPMKKVKEKKTVEKQASFSFNQKIHLTEFFCFLVILSISIKFSASTQRSFKFIKLIYFWMWWTTFNFLSYFLYGFFFHFRFYLCQFQIFRFYCVFGSENEKYLSNLKSFTFRPSISFNFDLEKESSVMKSPYKHCMEKALTLL